jgi:hypothetical protein
MFTYSTCTDCGGLLHVTTPSQIAHPGCTPKHIKIERLVFEWRDAVLADTPERETELYMRIEELDDRPPRLLDAAIRYAEWGWRVFPLKPNSKTPATRHGFKDATTDPIEVGAWWVRNPDYNIGLATGHTFDVIDIDAPAGYYSYLELIGTEGDELTSQSADLPNIHGRVSTAGHGLHLYVEPTGDGNRAGAKPGIDYRGVGGYVVAPPSVIDGRAWSWSIKPSPAIAGAACHK